jgi:hypothetical protein
MQDSETAYLRKLLRIVLMFIERKKLLHQFDEEVTEWWMVERAKMDRERAEAQH